jgi:HSP20 family molecular chaperone IbpA
MSAERRQSWMWAEACALLDEAERRHRHFFELLSLPSAAPAWEPPANVFTFESEVHVLVAVPGVRVDDIEVHLSGSGLSIEAKVPPPRFAVGVKVVRLEIPYGRMRRRIDLPLGNYGLLETRLENGYLFLRLAGSTR